MSIIWKDEEHNIVANENSLVDYKSYFNALTVDMKILSSTLPENVSITLGNGYVRIYGNLPSVVKNENYYATIRLTEYNEYGQKIDFSDRYFEIQSINKQLEWDVSIDETLDITMYTEVNVQLKLLNKNGNEIFKKIGGELPQGLKFNTDGVLYGSVNVLDENKTDYTFDVNVYVDGIEYTPSLKKSIKLHIIKPTSSTKPLWITEPGNLGNLSFGDVSTFRVVAYDVAGVSTVSYELDKSFGDEYRLPPGLYINAMTGRIEGSITSTQLYEYFFYVVATKLSDGEIIKSEPRQFSIKTNDVSKEHQIVWPTDDTIDLGNYYIGNEVIGYVPSATTEDGEIIKYYLCDGNIPKGLILNDNGVFGGVLESQQSGEYKFTIRAETRYLSSIKNVIMKLSQGLGKNSIKMYLRINNEYRDEYNDIKTQFNPNTIYKSDNSNFIVDSFPKIHVATLCCYDREILSHMLDFGNAQVVRFGKTVGLTHSQVNNYGESIENYEVFYKEIDELTYDWKEIKNGNYDFELKLQQMKENGFIHKDSELNFNNAIYDSNAEIYGDTKTNPRVAYSIFNFKNVRDILSQKIYLKRMGGEYYYSQGNQQLFDIKTINRIVYLYKDIKTKEYKISDDMNIHDYDQIVKYEHNCIYDSNNVFMKKTLFHPCGVDGSKLYENGNSFLLMDESCEPYYLKKIINPLCLDRNNTKIEITNVPSEYDIVLPLITEDDVKTDTDGSLYVRFLNYEVESLPEWKRKKAKNWESETHYYVGDVIIYNSVYYSCLQEFKTGDVFEFDANILKVLNIDELNTELSKEYFPTLDLGYYESGTNRYYLNKMNERETKYGDNWYNKDFLFYEVICEPVYESDADVFGVQFVSLKHPVYYR